MRRMTRPRRRPGRRLLLWWGAPPLILAALLAGFLSGGRAWPQWRAAVLSETARLGLAVDNIKVEGRTTTDRQTILDALGAHLGTPILAVSPARAEAQLEKLPWVQSATIERRLPDTILVRLVERRPLALWQHGGKVELIDQNGAVIPVTRLGHFGRLPVVVGEDAAQHAAKLLAMLASKPALAARVGAAVRIGGRRWNLRLDNAIEVLLPETGAAAAWAELARLDRSEQLLERDVVAVDLRLPDRLVLRVGADALPQDKPGTKKRRRTASST